MNSVSSMLFCYIGLRPKYILRMNQVLTALDQD